MKRWVWDQFLSDQGSRPRIGPWLYVVDNVYERLTYITGNGWPYGEEMKPMYETLDRIIHHAGSGRWEIFTLGNPTR